MENETIPTTQSTKRLNGIVTNVVRGSWRGVNSLRKVKYQKVIAATWIISSRYLKAVVTSDQIYERSVQVQIDRKGIEANESDSSSSGWIRRKCPSSEI
jgi:hypothetical protein